MGIKYLRFFLLKLALWFYISGMCQTPVVTIGSVCTDGIVSVPISVDNFDNVSGFMLRLSYDPLVLSFTSHNILNSNLFTSSVTNDAVGGLVSLSIPYDSTLLNINGGYIYILNFVLTTPVNTLLEWDTAMLFDFGGALIPAITVDGGVVIPPVFSQQPTAQNVCEGPGNSVTFNCLTGMPTQNYHWQVSYNGGMNWAYLVNDINYSGVNSPVLTLNSPSILMDQNRYRCSMEGPCTAISDEAILQVNTNIILHPHDTVIENGGTAVFRAEGTGLNPTYEWEVSTDAGNTWSPNSLFPVVNTPTITIINPPPTWSGYLFRCHIGGDCAPPTTISQIGALWIGNTAIKEQNNSTLHIYPNPATSCFYLQGDESLSDCLFSLYDTKGTLLMQFVTETGTQRIDVSNLSPGFYMYHIMTQDKQNVKTGKIILGLH